MTSRHSRTARLSGVLAVAAAAGLALAGCVGSDGESGDGPAAGATLSVTPGAGGDCTSASPCDLEAALGRAAAASVIELGDGDYGTIEPAAQASLAGLAENVVVTAADGATPVIAEIRSVLPNVTWKGLSVGGVVYLDEGSDGTVLDGVHVTGSGLFVHSSDIVVTGSTFEGGSSVDGIQFSGASNVLVENSTVRDYDQLADNDIHADCVQIFDSTQLTLRGNYFGNCHNASVIFSPGAGDGIRDVTIESNLIQGCIEKSEKCQHGTLLDLREKSASDITIRSNTMLDGSIRVEQVPGLVFDRNIVDYVSNCDMPMTNTIVRRWNEGLCSELDAIGDDGNIRGEVDVVDRDSGDLRLAEPGQATIDGVGETSPAEQGYDGAKLPHDVAGAG